MTQEYKQAFRVAFNFLDKWQPCPETLEQWEAIGQEAAIIHEQSGGNKFLCSLLVAVIDELERQYSQERTETKCG